MVRELLQKTLAAGAALFLAATCVSCKQDQDRGRELSIPAGYYATLDITQGSRLYRFGPFVGYYFRPQDPNNLQRLDFFCFNEQNFYTLDLPENALLFSGEAVFAVLPDTEFKQPVGKERIVPVFERSIPEKWKATRPAPKQEFRHFHSVHDAQGAAMTGYWLRHVADKDFTYDMGGRVGKDSPLYHKVVPGVDLQFPFIVEFDHGST